MISSIILLNSNVLLCLVSLNHQNGCSFKFVRKKKKIRLPKKDAAETGVWFSVSFNFFAPCIYLYYIPHNYVIPQATLLAISQTHSVFYPHRSQIYLKTPLLHIWPEPQADTFDTFSEPLTRISDSDIILLRPIYQPLARFSDIFDDAIDRDTNANQIRLC